MAQILLGESIVTSSSEFTCFKTPCGSDSSYSVLVGSWVAAVGQQQITVHNTLCASHCFLVSDPLPACVTVLNDPVLSMPARIRQYRNQDWNLRDPCDALDSLRLYAHGYFALEAAHYSAGRPCNLVHVACLDLPHNVLKMWRRRRVARNVLTVGLGVFRRNRCAPSLGPNYVRVVWE